jgi:dynein heavy chain 1
VDEWLDSLGKDRQNVDPEKIPWDALRTLICQSVFGGKIDNDFDNKILASLVNQFFRAESFNFEFPLFTVATDSEENILKIPDVKNYKGFLQWIKDLPSIESPTWSGLPLNVEKLVRERQTIQLIANIKMIQTTGDDLAEGGAEDAKKESESKASWLVSLQHKIEKMLKNLPGQLPTMVRTSNSIQNPLFRFLEREVTVGSSLLDQVRNDLTSIKEMCSGERKSTNVLKALAKELHSDVIPKKWRKYNIANIPVTEWITDFTKRIDQL